MLDPQQEKVADRVVFSPAERAVLCEQAETLKVDLDALIKALQQETPKDALDVWVKAHIPWDYLHDIFSKKITAAIYDIHREEGHQ